MALFVFRWRACAPRLVIHPKKEMAMTWKTPRIVEIAVGMEINCYACAEL
jgi:coenzyme PQQ precursor peptide PqqA